MSPLLIVAMLVLAVAAGLVLVLRRGPGADAASAAPPAVTPATAPTPAATPAATSPATPTPSATASAMPAPAPASTPLPAALRAFRLVAHDSLPADQATALVQRLQQIPPPPLALHRLVSADFLEVARPSALAELIMAEAQIAARLLATVNSPRYGLRRPVASVVQAIGLLGLNTVRGLCLQHLLHHSLGHPGPAQRQRLDRLLHASTLSSALCERLATPLGLAEPGALVTQVVLGHLGPLASTVLLSPDSPAWGPQPTLLARLQAEQQALGLGAGELGVLLMQTWGLPASIVQDVRDADSLLLTPAHLVDPRRAPRLALCYLSARLGERLAQGSLASLAELPAAADGLGLDPADPDLAHLGSYLALPALAPLPGLLRAPALAEAMTTLQAEAAVTD